MKSGKLSVALLVASSALALGTSSCSSSGRSTSTLRGTLDTTSFSRGDAIVAIADSGDRTKARVGKGAGDFSIALKRGHSYRLVVTSNGEDFPVILRSTGEQIEAAVYVESGGATVDLGKVSRWIAEAQAGISTAGAAVEPPVSNGAPPAPGSAGPATCDDSDDSDSDDSDSDDSDSDDSDSDDSDSDDSESDEHGDGKHGNGEDDREHGDHDGDRADPGAVGALDQAAIPEFSVARSIGCGTGDDDSDSDDSDSDDSDSDDSDSDDSDSEDE